MGRDARRLPEPAHAVYLRRREPHMRRELVGEPADLAAAHGVGLAGQRERRGAHLADPCRGEMAVENGVDLVGALRRLVDALRIKRDHPRRVTEHRKERRHVCFRKTGRERRGSGASGHAPGPCQRLVEAGGVCLDIVGIERAVVRKMHQQSAEQGAVGTGPHAQEEIGICRGVGPARIDHDHARAALLLVGKHALVQHRMAPRRVRADQHQEISFVEILITAGHGVGAESTAVTRNCRRHAEPRIGVDIGRADESLHQLVGDVIILGQQLPGEIERDRIGAVARDDMLEPVGDVVERVAPGDPLHHALAAADHRIKQPALEAERFAERRALRAQPPQIGGMVRIARDGGAAVVIGRRQHAAADTAIGTSRAGGAKGGIDRRHMNEVVMASGRLG